jgi:nitroreductase
METLKAIALRQSTRQFKPEQIPESALQTILEAGAAAPIGMGDYSSVHLTAVQDAALLKKISQTAATALGKSDSDPLYGAPTLIVVSAKESSAGIELANAGCVVENILLAATDLGLGNVYIMGALLAFKADPALLPALKTPEGFKPVGSAAIGFAASAIDQVKAGKNTIAINRI